MVNINQRRKSDRLRQKRWRNRQLDQGKKQVSAMISLKAQLILNREKKRSGENNSQVIERAIIALVKDTGR